MHSFCPMLVQVSTLTGLTNLLINSCPGLGGTIPASISLLTDLRQFSLYSTAMTGTLPPQLSTLKFLSRLGIIDNRITGPLPAAYSTLASLNQGWFQMSNNRLTGTLPQALSSLGYILTVSNNAPMCGLIPNYYGLDTTGTGLGVACPTPTRE